MAAISKLIIILMIIGFVAAPALAAFFPPLVPECGQKSPPGSPPRVCGYQDFLQLIGNLFNYLVLIATPLATAMIVWGGVVLVTAGTNEGKRSQAKSIIGSAIWGLVLTLAAWLIVRTIMVGLIGEQSPFLPGFLQ
ncbi:MAG: pilin [Patescibacteria group bacterium]